eukprot:TRINITY_DN860_c0_g9_i1.p1 TRINITY_DN860_c0_g9~~TRINITY_DN860_c0_g9_i1.p1  ORF type:complete len:276 (+),score=41.46 TRINITY_DN860_c0_g9_i1:69-896(+)
MEMAATLAHNTVHTAKYLRHAMPEASGESSRQRSCAAVVLRPSDRGVEAVLSRQSSYLGRILTQSETSSSTTSQRSYRLRVESAKRVRKEKKFLLSSTIVAAEGSEEQVLQLAQEIVAWGKKQQESKASGISDFTCTYDTFDKNVYHFWEVYNSFQAMNDCRASPEYSEFTNKVRPLLAGPIGMAVYEYADGQIGHMLNPIGPKGEGGLDDATGQGTGGGASYKQTSGTVDLGNYKRAAWGMEKMISDEAEKSEEEAESTPWSFQNIIKNLTKKQ